ncbi:MAG: TonB-dependent receptor [Calditrichaeota bacterium]|nr:MAG: TonB-dependent receptor [Calditrichota bacterium]
MNILTDAAAADPGIMYKQEVGSGNFFKETFTANTGLLGNGLAATIALVRKTGRGVVDQTWTDAWAYFGALSWTVNKSHRFDLFAIGAPQKHGHRLYTQSISRFDRDYARELYERDRLPEDIIASLDNAPSYGRNYNPNWGPIFNFDANDLKEYYNGSTHDFSNRTPYMDGEEVSGASVLMERENYYHKPQFNLNWYWNISNNLLLTNVAYVSIGKGGGTGRLGSRFGYFSDGPFAGQIDWQSVYDNNTSTLAQDADPDLVAQGLVGANERKASTAIRNSVNQHFWYGLLTTAEYRMNRNTKLTLGFDGRYYKGEHWREVRNLLGGDYILDFGDKNQSSPVKRLGDKVVYHNDGFTRWIGGFFQVESRHGPLTGFISGSVSQTSYKRKDYFVDKDAYKEPGSKILPPESDWYNFTGGTIKIGANYNMSPEWNLYANVGYFSKAPIFDAVFDFSHQLYEQTFNEKVKAVEIGSGYRTGNFYSNINFYYTRWEDRTWSRSVTTQTGTPIYFLLQGIDARHTGVELDWNYRPSRWIELRSALSVGDWIWLNDVKTTYAPEDDPTNLTTFNVYAKGLKVGDAAQKSLALALTLYPVKDTYLNATMTTFGDHFADFDPSRRTNPNDRSQAWLVPNYTLIDLHFGYTLPFKLADRVKLELFGHVFNLLDEKYITDADDGSDHTAATARVFMGVQRRFNVGLNVNL